MKNKFSYANIVSYDAGDTVTLLNSALVDLYSKIDDDVALLMKMGVGMDKMYMTTDAINNETSLYVDDKLIRKYRLRYTCSSCRREKDTCTCYSSSRGKFV